MDKGVFEIKKLEEKVISEEKTIENLERTIEKKEQQILKSQKALLNRVGGVKSLLGGGGGYHAKFLRYGIIKRFNKHKILYSFITLLSVVLIWSGLQTFITKTPAISNPVISITLGLLIVWFIDRELV